MSRPRLLIEQWLPIETIGAECMRDASAAKKPPLNRLHVWWARRPPTVSRAAILASLLPAYPTEDEPDVESFPDSLRSRFPNFESYKGWFLRLMGIMGDPVAGKRIIEWAKHAGKKLTFNPYGYPRAFTANPSIEQLDQLYDLLEWTWGTRRVRFCDPMAGGGSIPFEAVRYGLLVSANELNPVASIILKATVEYPATLGDEIAGKIDRYGRMLAERVAQRLTPFFPTVDAQEQVFAYLWARTIPCPHTGKPVPLLPNLWLRKDATPCVIRVVADATSDCCKFEILEGKEACEKAKPDLGTIRRGTAISPWTGETIDGDYIKAEARAGRMAEQMIAVGVKSGSAFRFREPTTTDLEGFDAAARHLSQNWRSWESQGLIPLEPRREGRADWACEIYGIKTWSDTYNRRQLLSHVVCVDEIWKVKDLIYQAEVPYVAEAILTYLAMAVGKCVARNSFLSRWIPQRCVLSSAFDRHDFAMKWSFGEFDAARSMMPWAVDQVVETYKELCRTIAPNRIGFFTGEESRVDEKLRITNEPAQATYDFGDGEFQCITVDPPYYDNVNYAECSNYFYVWQKRILGEVSPRLFNSELTNQDDEAVMNVARFKAAGKNAKKLAASDYENKIASCFKEMNRTLAEDGVLTVMFTHKQVEAWDTLGSALIRSGFHIVASWPIHTEFEHSLHQARKNAAASTILLVCRKREATSEPAWWDDLKGKVRETARETAKRFEDEGIRGVDLYISTFGPVLSIISERWPVLTSNTDPKTGKEIPLQPGEALDLARREVINLRKQGLLLGRSVEFDPVTDWYLMAWDAFRAQEFPADEARKLALALGLDLEANLIRDKRLVSKKGKNVTLALTSVRRKKGMVDPDAEAFPHLIDALHTAMMVYEEDGSKACQVFIDRHGLRNDSRIKALVQAAMQAIPTTRGKDGKFLRPEMSLLDSLRLLVWDDLPAPPEEVAPVIEKTRLLPGMPGVEEELGDGDEELDEDGDDEEDE
jgi:adenine-specific DNA methylase